MRKFITFFLAITALTTLSSIGMTQQEQALLQAVQTDNINKARELVTQGVSVNIREKGFGFTIGSMKAFDLTPLMRAVYRHNKPMVELLLKSGARAQAQTPNGVTAADIAHITNQRDILDLLVPPGTSRILQGYP